MGMYNSQLNDIKKNEINACEYLRSHQYGWYLSYIKKIKKYIFMKFVSSYNI